MFFSVFFSEFCHIFIKLLLQSIFFFFSRYFVWSCICFLGRHRLWLSLYDPEKSRSWLSTTECCIRMCWCFSWFEWACYERWRMHKSWRCCEGTWCWSRFCDDWRYHSRFEPIISELHIQLIPILFYRPFCGAWSMWWWHCREGWTEIQIVLRNVFWYSDGEAWRKCRRIPRFGRQDNNRSVQASLYFYRNYGYFKFDFHHVNIEFKIQNYYYFVEVIFRKQCKICWVDYDQLAHILVRKN